MIYLNEFLDNCDRLKSLVGRAFLRIEVVEIVLGGLHDVNLPGGISSKGSYDQFF